MGAHINADGQFQSDKYPTCPPGKVPLSVKDKTAQDLLWVYAQRRRVVDAEFSDDLEASLGAAGFDLTLIKRSEGNADLTLWCVHVLGADDLHAQPSHAAAVSAADQMNRFMAESTANKDNDLLCFSYAAPWPYSVDDHAADIAHQAELEEHRKAAVAAATA